VQQGAEQLSLIWEDRTGADVAAADDMLSNDDDEAGSVEGGDRDGRSEAPIAAPQLSDESSTDGGGSDVDTVPSTFASLLHKHGLADQGQGASSSDDAASSDDDEGADDAAERAMTDRRQESGRRLHHPFSAVHSLM
jgi:hypothetical protein